MYLLKIKKYIFWINDHALIEKESNKYWNTHIHLERNSPRIKVSFIFWLFIMTLSTYVFIASCGLNGCVYLLEIVLGILAKLIPGSQKICGCLILNKMHIELASLIICLINYNLSNNSSVSPTEVKKYYYIVNLIT